MSNQNPIFSWLKKKPTTQTNENSNKNIPDEILNKLVSICKRENIPLSNDQLAELYVLHSDYQEIINHLLKAKQLRIDINFQYFRDLYQNGIEVSHFFEVQALLQNSEVAPKIDEMKMLAESKLPPEKIAIAYKMGDKAKLNIPLKKLVELAPKFDVEKAMRLLVTAKNMETELSVDVFFDLFPKTNEVEKVIYNFLLSKKAKFNFSINDITEIVNQNVDCEQLTRLLYKYKNAGIALSEGEVKKLTLTNSNALSIINDYATFSEDGFSLNDIQEFYNQNINIRKHIDIFRNLRNLDNSLKINELTEFLKLENKLDNIIRAFQYSQQNDLKINLLELRKLASANVDLDKLTNSLLRLKTKGEFFTITELSTKANPADLEKFINGLIALKNGDSTISLKEILSHYNISTKDLEKMAKTIKMTYQNHIGIEVKDILKHHFEGGNIENVVNGLIYAKTERITLSLQTALELDSATYDVEKVVKNVMNVKIVDIAPVNVVTQDEIPLMLKVKATLKPNIDKYLRGLNEEIATAKINEALIAAVASYGNRNVALENLDKISFFAKEKIFQDKSFREQSAYEILTISILDVLVGKDPYAENRDKEHNIRKTLSEFEKKFLEMELRIKELETKMREWEN